MLIQREKFLQKYKKIPAFRVKSGKDSLMQFQIYSICKAMGFGVLARKC